MNEEARNIAKKYLSDEDYKKLVEECRKVDHYLTDAIKKEQQKLFRKCGRNNSTMKEKSKDSKSNEIVILDNHGDILRVLHSVNEFMKEYGKTARIELSNVKPYRLRLNGKSVAQFKYWYDMGESGVYGETHKKKEWVEREITPIVQVDECGNVLQEFTSLNDAMRAFRCGNKVILNRPYITFYPRRGIYLQCREDHDKGYRFR